MNPFVLLEIVFWKGIISKSGKKKKKKKKKTFSRKLNHFLVLGSDLENELENVLWCLLRAENQ